MSSSASLRPLPLAIGSVVAGKYRIDAVLGIGGMGTVFAAVNMDLGRPVAIKVLHHDLAQDDDLAHRLRQEARAAAAIGHPGIVDVLDLGTTDAGDPFIVMERLEGEPLGARLANRTRLPPATAVGILVKVVEALAAAHAKGILHRDLKPDNIFLILQPTPSVKLVDFGLSKQQSGDLSITRSGVVMGTPLYMSPEQARGARDVGPASDLYSIGAILYQTLAGVPPHTASNYNEMLAAILLHEPTPLDIAVPTLPTSLTSLVHELLAKEPTVRPTAVETANRLRTIERTLDDSRIAFSPTLQPDNVSDDEVAAPARPTYEPTLPPARAAHATPALEATVPSIPPLGTTAPSLVGRPSSPSGTLAVSSAPAPIASRRSPLVFVVLGLVAIAIIVIVVLTRRTQPVVVLDAAGTAVDAAPMAVDAAAPADLAVADAPGEPDAPVRDAPPPRDAPRVDAPAPPPRDAAAPRPDAARTAVDAGDGLDIDTTNPIAPRR